MSAGFPLPPILSSIEIVQDITNFRYDCRYQWATSKILGPDVSIILFMGSGKNTGCERWQLASDFFASLSGKFWKDEVGQMSKEASIKDIPYKKDIFHPPPYVPLRWPPPQQKGYPIICKKHLMWYG